MWQIDFNDVARADLLSLEKSVCHRILNFLEERIANHPAPKQLRSRYKVNSKAASFSNIRQNTLTILVLFLDHRSAVYKNRSLPSDFEFGPDEGK